jgi:hypothetical protein
MVVNTPNAGAATSPASVHVPLRVRRPPRLLGRVCPGNNKTGGKAKPGHTRPGDRWLKAILGSAALGATRKKNTYLSAQYRRIAARRGAKRAQSAIAHSILVAAWHVLSTGTPYQDLGADYFIKRDNPDYRRRRAIAQLEQLGYQVALETMAA